MEACCYEDAFRECTSIEIDGNDGFPQRLCSDCAAKLTIAYQFRKEAIESDNILRSYGENENNENDMYENAKFQDDEIFEYETLDEMEEDNVKTEVYTETITVEGGNDAVSFLTGILKKGPASSKRVVELKKIRRRGSPEAEPVVDDSNRKHACNVCQKKFQKRSNLIDHLRLHANVKVFSCEFCEKSFVQAGNFKAHLRTHTKEKPYQCSYCSKSYSQSSSLKIHIRSHTQEKNYICDICEKGFTNASDCGKHKLIHDPVKRYRCDECQRPFTQKVHLRKHIEKHHPGANFSILFKQEMEKEDTKIIFEECIVDDDNGDDKNIAVI